MITYGLVIETYGKYVKVRTTDGEFIIKSDKSPPKKGTKIEVKDFGKGDYTARVVAKRPGEFAELPNVKFVDLAEKILERLFAATSNNTETLKNPQFYLVTSKDKNFVTTAIALFIEELSKRVDISNVILEKIQKILIDDDTSQEKKKNEYLLNLLSGRYGLKHENGNFTFLDRKNSTFHILTSDNRIIGKIEEGIESLALIYFEKIPENIQLLESNLKKYFQVVSIKLINLSEGAYV